MAAASRSILEKIDHLSSGEGSDIPPAVLANGRQLLTFLPTEPEDCSRGYWPTLRLHLADAEIEVFADHYELYLFNTGAVDVTHIDHAAGDPPSAELTAALLRLPT